MTITKARAKRSKAIAPISTPVGRVFWSFYLGAWCAVAVWKLAETEPPSRPYAMAIRLAWLAVIAAAAVTAVAYWTLRPWLNRAATALAAAVVIMLGIAVANQTGYFYDLPGVPTLSYLAIMLPLPVLLSSASGRLRMPT